MSNKRVACVIPARLESKRFPKKILSELAGKPLVEWVWNAACRVDRFDEVLFAIDSPITAQALDRIGARYVFTSDACRSGTDRLIEVVKKSLVSADIIVGWQCDEPFITQSMINDLLHNSDNQEVDVWTLKYRMMAGDDVTCPNNVKVVTDTLGRALYFSRSPIPFYAHTYTAEKVYFKHVGIYAFSYLGLLKIAALQPGHLERAESLEQLRFLQNNCVIQVNETQRCVVGIDTQDDLLKAERYIQTLENIHNQ